MWNADDNTDKIYKPFNRTTVECKFRGTSVVIEEPGSFNRTTVECKYILYFYIFYIYFSFNRTTVECK